MFAVVYITVVLLQFSLSQELQEYDFEIPQELHTISSLNEVMDNDQIESIQPSSVEDSDSTKAADSPSLNSHNDDIEDLEQPINVASDVPINIGEVAIATNYGCEESCNGTLDKDGTEENSEESSDISDDVPPKTCIRISSLEAEGDVTIVARFECKDESRNLKTFETSKDTDSQEIVDKSIANASVSFGGPVYAQGKVSVGTHYGCGVPVRMSPTFLPPPWFSSLYPGFYHPAFYSYSAQYPSYMQTEPWYSPDLQYNLINESFEDSREYLPVASFLADPLSVAIDNEKVNQHGNVFNGIVPAKGTVSIAARF